MAFLPSREPRRTRDDDIKLDIKFVGWINLALQMQ